MPDNSNSTTAILQFEDIIPWVEGAGDTGLSARLKLKRNFERIRAWAETYAPAGYYTKQEADARFLSKLADDVAEGRITFLQGIAVVANAVFDADIDVTGDAAVGGSIDVVGDAEVAGLARLTDVILAGVLKSPQAREGFQDGQGLIVDTARAFIEADGINVRGFMRVMELVINRLQLMESDYSFTEGGQIETVTDNGDGTLTLLMHKEHDRDLTPFAEDDIIYAKVNDLLAHGTYYTSWMRVVSKDTDANTLTVVLYPDSEVPEGRNFPPTAMANVTRHGNATNTERQQAWVLSTTDKRLSFFWRVDKPIIEDHNYALCLGILPDLQNLPSTRDRSKPSLYVDTIFYDHSHRANYPARIVKEDRGQWLPPDESIPQPAADAGDGTLIFEPYHCRTFTRAMWLQYRNSPSYASLTDEELRQKMLLEWKVDLETSRTWHHGILWECTVDATTQEPSFGCTDWTAVSGDTVCRMQIHLSLGEWMALGEENVMTCAVYYGLEDITRLADQWTITRDSGDAAEDAAWNASQKAQDFQGTLTLVYSTDPATNDLGPAVPTIFTVRAMRDGDEMAHKTVEV